MATNENPKINHNQRLSIDLPDGRVLNVWCGPEMDHMSVDVWTTRGREVEDISASTGDTSRAPVGMFAFTNGRRESLNRGPESFTEHGWPAVATVVLLWDREPPTLAEFHAHRRTGETFHEYTERIKAPTTDDGDESILLAPEAVERERNRAINKMNEVTARRQAGIDTADDSAIIKGFLDVFPPTTKEGAAIAVAFTAEWAEWDKESEEGLR